MIEKIPVSLCLDCKYQNGIHVNDRELDTYCMIKQNVDCNKVFECNDFVED